MRLLPRVYGGQPEEEIRLAVMAGESIDANVRLRLTANRTYVLEMRALDYFPLSFFAFLRKESFSVIFFTDSCIHKSEYKCLLEIAW